MRRQVFKLTIVDQNDKVVEIPAGGRLERDFVEEVVKRATAKGVGIGKTQRQVTEILREEITAFLSELKYETKRVV